MEDSRKDVSSRRLTDAVAVGVEPEARTALAPVRVRRVDTATVLAQVLKLTTDIDNLLSPFLGLAESQERVCKIAKKISKTKSRCISPFVIVNAALSCFVRRLHE